MSPPSMTRASARRAARALPIVLLPLVQSCAPTLDLKRLTYETLRREDCRVNQLEEFCQRTFANDYAEYERLRREFMRETRERRERGRTDTAGTLR